MEPYIIGPPLKPPLAGSWSLLSVDFHEIENYVFFLSAIFKLDLALIASFWIVIWWKKLSQKVDSHQLYDSIGTGFPKLQHWNFCCKLNTSSKNNGWQNYVWKRQ